MNPETKRFEPETVRTPEGWPRFAVGERFTLKGVTMQVRKVTRKDVILRPVSGTGSEMKNIQQLEVPPKTEMPGHPVGCMCSICRACRIEKAPKRKCDECGRLFNAEKEGAAIDEDRSYCVECGVTRGIK